MIERNGNAASVATIDRPEQMCVRMEAQQVFLQFQRGALLIDIRPSEERELFGEIPGTIILEQNGLRNQLDVTSTHHHPAVMSWDQPMILLCNTGDISSIAVAELEALGLSHVSDLVGGFVEWKRAGLPIIPGSIDSQQRSAA